MCGNLDCCLIEKLIKFYCFDTLYRSYKKIISQHAKIFKSGTHEMVTVDKTDYRKLKFFHNFFILNTKTFDIILVFKSIGEYFIARYFILVKIF